MRGQTVDFTTLLRSAVRNTSTATSNGPQSVSFTELPQTILEAFIPGYSLISRFILLHFGLDISLLVSTVVVAFAFFTAANYAWDRISFIFGQYLMSSIYIEDRDDLFDNVLDWIAEQRVSKVARRVRAVSKHGTVHGYDDEDEEEYPSEDLFHFAKWAAKTPPRYEPYFGTHRFWYNGRFFTFSRNRREVKSSPWLSSSEEQTLQLTCIGRSTKPIKELLEIIKAWSIDKEKAVTVIRRPAPKEMRRYAGTWSRVTSRPSRPLNTVVLDPDVKSRLITDVNEYLHPSSPKWYATRGIPYRRGYLFYGPPGTGKSSLSFAIAGLFGLDIYVISLLEPTLTESDLSQLFSNLPRRCVVLLEDIDTAGLYREPKEDDDGSGNAASSSAQANAKDDSIHSTGGDDARSDSISAADLARELKKANRKDKHADDANKGISLSGLLNAIDGVASHEGRVLVMTTNHIEKLDEALIRPGRVDMQVRFDRATQFQAREIFVRMYSSDAKTGKKAVAGNAARPVANGTALNGTAGKSPGMENGVAKTNIPYANGSSIKNKRSVEKIGATTNGHTVQPTTNGALNGSLNGALNGAMNGNLNGAANGALKPSPLVDVLPRDELEDLAQRFAAHIPEGKLSPAEIQNYLITRKKEPQRALEEVEAWIEEVAKSKEGKGRGTSPKSG